MYECQMKMVIPPGVGLLVAGLASGICFLLIGSLRKGKGEKSIDDNRCACCLKPFLVGRGVECSDCGGRSCRKACCRWDSVDNAWFCLFCYHSRSWSRKKEKWFKNFGGLPVESEACKNFSTAKSRVYDEGAEDVAIHTELDLAAGGCKETDSMETVREFVEKIVEGLVGNVDDTPIDRLYDHPAYDRLFEAYGELLASALTRLAISLKQCVDNKPATDTPTMAHTALRELVERAVDEARKLPSLGATVSTGLQDDLSLSEQNYEDLLATAILNKVIEKFQNERVDGNSNVLQRKPKSKLVNHDNETELDEDEEGGSSLEPLSHDDRSSDDSGPRMRHVHVRQEPLSLTIEEQIEEVTTTYTSDEEPRCPKTTVLDFRNARRVPFPEFGMDIVDPSQDSSDDSQDDGNDVTHVDRITPVESWEENWLFQKRKIQTQSEPVAMLVPNPSSDFRALIGDRDAEDTSDLSEFSAQSDDEAEDDELTEATSRIVPKAGKADNDFSPESEARKIIELSESLDPKAEASTSKEETLEVDVYSEPEFVNGTNDDECRGKTSQSGDEPKEKCSGTLTNTADLEKLSKTNGEIPKTPTSLTRNFLTENTAESSVGCDDRWSNDVFAAIQEKVATKELSRTEKPTIAQAGSEDKIEKKDDHAEEDVFPSGIEVDRHSQSAATIGCPEVNSRDANDDERREVGGSGRCNGIQREVLKNSSNADVKSNGDSNGIQDRGGVCGNANGTFSEDTNRRCEALAQAKADSASEKPSLKGEVNENIGLATPPRPGTIAEREHKKWENAAPIENNPYSEENIQKRLLERQYSRRSSDVSGSTKLQTCPSPPLQIVLGAGRPDHKRFGRDYYINEARNPKGQSVEESGFFTATSRPNSSLSQHSLSIGSDYEQQVSHGLDRFEEASLRGSLRRRSYRGPNASPHFVTNPLVHLDLDENYDASSGSKSHVNPSSQRETLEAINPVMHNDLSTKNDMNFQLRESSSTNNREHFDLKNGIDILVDAKNPFVKDVDEDSTINPLYNCEDEISRLFGAPFPADHDSGMYSIDSVDFEYCGSDRMRQIESDARDLARLNWSHREDEQNYGRAFTSDGRKYWTLTSQEINTFGGIKRRKGRWLDADQDLDADDDITVAKGSEDYQDFGNDTDDDFFAGLKFQTFGGIKTDSRTRETSKYRKQKVRPTVRNLEIFEDKMLSGIFKKSRSRLINSKVSTLPPVVATRKSIETNVVSDDDAQSLKLEPPEVPQVVHRSFKSLQDLRQGSGSRNRRKVRSKC